MASEEKEIVLRLRLALDEQSKAAADRASAIIDGVNKKLDTLERRSGGGARANGGRSPEHQAYLDRVRLNTQELQETQRYESQKIKEVEKAAKARAKIESEEKKAWTDRIRRNSQEVADMQKYEERKTAIAERSAKAAERARKKALQGVEELARGALLLGAVSEDSMEKALRMIAAFEGTVLIGKGLKGIGAFLGIGATALTGGAIAAGIGLGANSIYEAATGKQNGVNAYVADKESMLLAKGWQLHDKKNRTDGPFSSLANTLDRGERQAKNNSEELQRLKDRRMEAEQLRSVYQQLYDINRQDLEIDRQKLIARRGIFTDRVSELQSQRVNALNSFAQLDQAQQYLSIAAVKKLERGEPTTAEERRSASLIQTDYVQQRVREQNIASIPDNFRKTIESGLDQQLEGAHAASKTLADAIRKKNKEINDLSNDLAKTTGEITRAVKEYDAHELGQLLDKLKSLESTLEEIRQKQRPKPVKDLN